MTELVTLQADPSRARRMDEPPAAASLASISIRGARRAAPSKPGKIEAHAGILGHAAARQAERIAPATRHRSIEDLIHYWAQLRAGRHFPSPSDIDPAVVTQAWPNTMLLKFEGLDGSEPADSVPRVIRLADPTEGGGSAGVAMTPMVIDWVLGLARRSLRSAGVIREATRFPGTAGGQVEAALLPLSLRGSADHVLCHLRRA